MTPYIKVDISPFDQGLAVDPFDYSTAVRALLYGSLASSSFLTYFMALEISEDPSYPDKSLIRLSVAS